MTRATKRSPVLLSAAAAIALLIAAPACHHDAVVSRRKAVEDRVYETRDPAIAGDGDQEHAAGNGDLRDEQYAVRINRTLLYPVRWGRAEDLVETLRPVLESRYGAGVVIVSHPPTNHLMIYLPPLGEREASRRGTGAQTPQPGSATTPGLRPTPLR